LTRLVGRIEDCSKGAFKHCRHGMTADAMSGHKGAVITSRVDKQGRRYVVGASRADEQKGNEGSGDQQGQNKWSTADE